MSDSDFLGRGWKFPFTMSQGSLQTSEGADSIRESILIILQTAPGERVMRPNFGCGIHEFVFHPNNSSTANVLAHEVKQSLLKFEPRINVDNVKVYSDPEEGSRMNIEIEYTIRAFNARENLVFPFFLENR